MAGVKIITVLKDDTFPEILEAFRTAQTGEVIFVLPRNGKIFRTEDQFAAFAAEAAQGKKSISIMTATADTAELAKKYGFAVVHSGKRAPVKKPKAQLASIPPPQDPDIQDFSQDAYQDDVMVPSDETMNVQGEDEVTEESEEEEAPLAELTAATIDGVRATEGGQSVTIPKQRERQQEVPVSHGGEGDFDYLDTMWRDKVGVAQKGKRFFGGAISAAAAGGRRISKGMVIGMFIAAVGILVAALYFIGGSATIELAPVSASLNFQFTAQAAPSFSSLDTKFNKLPGQLLEITKTATATHHASGSRDVASKARGTLTVSNSYANSPQTLVATTRFVSEDGKVFRTLQTITIPGSTVSNGETIPGTIDVAVIADRPGDDYNVPAGTFIIAAFKEQGDTERVAKIYGIAEQPLSGGASGPSSVVTQSDYDTAVSEATANVTAALAAAIPPESQGLTILGSDNPPVTVKTATARPDDAAPDVMVTMESQLTTVAFRTEDLANLIRAAALTQERRAVLPDKLDISFSGVAYDESTGILSFTVRATGIGYVPLNTDLIVRDLMGKDAAAVQEYFRNRSTEIDAAEVRFSPFWTKRIPRTTADVTIHLRYGDTLLTPSPEGSVDES